MSSDQECPLFDFFKRALAKILLSTLGVIATKQKEAKNDKYDKVAIARLDQNKRRVNQNIEKRGIKIKDTSITKHEIIYQT